jgi:hypothetical protein
VERARMWLRRGNAGDREAARRSLAEATPAARALSMEGLASKADRLLVELARDSSEPARPGGVNRLGKVGDRWRLSYQGSAFELADSKGLQYLARLIRRQGNDLAVRDLASGELPSRLAASRLESLRAELEQADDCRDLGRRERLREEIERLTYETLQAHGPGSTGRSAAETERLRKAVTGRIREAIKRIRVHDEALAGHLDNSIKTGTLCSYRPEKRTEWEFSDAAGAVDATDRS